MIIKNPQTSVMNSLQFLGKLTVIAISKIVQARKLLPDQSFSSRKFDGEDVKILHVVEDIPETQSVVDWLKFAFSMMKEQELYVSNLDV